ncbi:MAG: hypothetical protein P1U61_04560 [Legionellaceae bacterium]|nr:hypothetical protein [Legionellaceae bacterium]
MMFFQSKQQLESTPIYPMTPLEKNADGTYPVDKTRCGVLPCYLNEQGQIVWGCVESNRVGPVLVNLPAGARDVIAIQGGHEIKLEWGKPFPDLSCSALTPFIGKPFRNDAYQEIVAVLESSGFQLFIENPLEAALHETQEEHGADVREHGGRDHHLLMSLLDCPEQEIVAKKGSEVMHVWVAHLQSAEGVVLNRTNKVDRKIKSNFGRAFYEQGCWGTLEYFKAKVHEEHVKFSSPEVLAIYNDTQKELIKGAFSACEGALSFLTSVEACVVSSLLPNQPRSSCVLL